MSGHPELIVFVAVYDLAALAALGLLLWACISDFFTMTIPNAVSVGLIVSFVIAFAAARAVGLPAFSPWPVHAAALAAMFALTFVMFVCRVWGAGDSKLASGIALWVGLKGFVPFLTVMSLSGLFLVAASYALRKSKRSFAGLGVKAWPAQLKAGAGTLPYGIAIAAGAVWAFYALGYFDLYTLMEGAP